MAAFQSLSGKPPSWPAAPGLSDFLQQYQFGVTVAFRRPQTIGWEVQTENVWKQSRHWRDWMHTRGAKVLVCQCLLLKYYHYDITFYFNLWLYISYNYNLIFKSQCIPATLSKLLLQRQVL